jgi:hypothetical protein
LKEGEGNGLQEEEWVRIIDWIRRVTIVGERMLLITKYSSH